MDILATLKLKLNFSTELSPATKLTLTKNITIFVITNRAFGQLARVLVDIRDDDGLLPLLVREDPRLTPEGHQPLPDLHHAAPGVLQQQGGHLAPRHHVDELAVEPLDLSDPAGLLSSRLEDVHCLAVEVRGGVYWHVSGRVHEQLQPDPVQPEDLLHRHGEGGQGQAGGQQEAALAGPGVGGGGGGGGAVYERHVTPGLDKPQN